MPMAYCRVLLCNINKKSSCCNGGFLFISNKHLVTFHFLLAIYLNTYFTNKTNKKEGFLSEIPRLFAILLKTMSSQTETCSGKIHTKEMETIEILFISTVYNIILT